MGISSRGDVEALTAGLQHGFNMATEAKHTMRISSLGDVEALTAGLQHGFNMASTWPQNPSILCEFPVVGMLEP